MSGIDYKSNVYHGVKVYVRGLELFGKLDSDTISNLFGNLDEVIRVNDGLEDELNKLRDDKGKKSDSLMIMIPKILTLACTVEITSSTGGRLLTFLRKLFKVNYSLQFILHFNTH